MRKPALVSDPLLNYVIIKTSFLEEIQVFNASHEKLLKNFIYHKKAFILGFNRSKLLTINFKKFK